MKVLKLNSESKKELLAELIKRSPEQMQGFESDVKEILKNVKENKDEALFYYTKKFDKFELNEENIKRLHDNGITVNCWTCDSPEEGEKLAGWGVDYITTNILE